MKANGQALNYDFAEKDRYRDALWKGLRNLCGPLRREMNVLMLPGVQGLEVGVAIREGFRESRFHFVDRNKAVVATVKRKYPKAMAYGEELEDIGSRLVREQRTIHVANLDLCGPTSGPLLCSLSAFVHSGCLPKTRPSFIAVTVLRGRERAWEAEWLRQRSADNVLNEQGLADQDFGRVLGVHMALEGSIQRQTAAMRYLTSEADRLRSEIGESESDLSATQKLLRGSWHPGREKVFDPNLYHWATYRSSAGTQSMLWMLWKLTPLGGTA